MKFQLLGSAAGKPVPRPFCKCRVCLHALEHGGRDLRTRTGMHLFLGDEAGKEPRYKIDLCPDTAHHMMLHGFNLHLLEHLLFTHAHEDHFDALYLRHRGRSIGGREHMLPLNLYGSSAVQKEVDNANLDMDDLQLEFHVIEPFTSFRAGDLEVFTLEGNHAPGTLHYIVQHAGKKVLLGWDTGWYGEATWEALESFQLDAIFMECTQFSPGEVIRETSHMNFYTLRKTRERLIEMGVIVESTPLVTLHMGDNGQMLHDERVELASPYNVTVGYDGLELDV